MAKKSSKITEHAQAIEAENGHIPPVLVTAYKGFDKELKCSGTGLNGRYEHQYEIGQTYEYAGEVELCRSGFHACLSPLDVLDYYPISNGNRYAVVQLAGVSPETRDDTKRAAKTITIVREITVADMIKAEAEYIAKAAADTAGQQAIPNTSSGASSKAASSGASSKAASSGDYSTAASSGDYSKAASSGDYSTAASSGDYSKAASSGAYSTAASSGNYSTAASSGDYSTAASSGDYSKAASSGNSSTAACDTNGFACIAGIGGRVKGNAGSALSLGYYDKLNHPRIAVAYVGEEGILPDTWYTCNDAGVFAAV